MHHFTQSIRGKSRESRVSDTSCQSKFPVEKKHDLNLEKNTDNMQGGTSQTPHWKLARYGITLLLNNQQEEAEALFKKHPDNITMYSGYAICIFMDALMTFEEEKLNAAAQILREIERRSSTSGWFRSVRSNGKESDSYAEHLESQIIRADSQLYLATLTFLQQDISAYFKGGWILRKSWKHYQQTYNEILKLYKRIVGEALPDDTIMHTMDMVSSTYQVAEEESENLARVISPDMEFFDQNEHLHGSENSMEDHDEHRKNGYLQKSSTMHFPPNQLLPQNSISLKKSQSVNESLSLSHLQRKFSFIGSLNPFGGVEGMRDADIDKETITRLMCSVSFGYGLLQLGMSLLPPSILKLTNFLGFQGNRKNGLANLTHSMSGPDMRAPLATLALLWYHTIVRPFFALDGSNVQAGVQVACKLIDEAMLEHADSSIFLFFKGRVDRLKSDIPAAVESFNASISNSRHREIRILSRHEVGWCHLIRLDYPNALQTFVYLKHQSRWSRCFYAYLCIISAGANRDLLKAGTCKELRALFSSSLHGSQLDEFMARRFRICPKEERALLSSKVEFWKLLVYELLYLWNSLASCSEDDIQQIIKDCQLIDKEGMKEPFRGLSHLVAGSSYCILKDYDSGARSFRKCLAERRSTAFEAGDSHVSAFALYELGQVLIRNPETKAEGKQCLQKIQVYKDYDFEQRLSVRIHSILKRL